MQKVGIDITMSLDGFIAGPHDDVERLHEWLYDLESFHDRHGRPGGERNPDSEVLEDAFATIGAMVMGRRMFDLAEGPWGDDPPFRMPVFVLTHEQREPIPKAGGTTFTFVTDGIESALKHARAAAGDKDVGIAGGADVIQQYLRAGLVDELQVHVAPVLLGEGRRLFEGFGPDHIELETVRVIDSPGVTHLKFRVAR